MTYVKGDVYSPIEILAGVSTILNVELKLIETTLVSLISTSFWVKAGCSYYILKCEL